MSMSARKFKLGDTVWIYVDDYWIESKVTYACGKMVTIAVPLDDTMIYWPYNMEYDWVRTAEEHALACLTL